MSGQGAHEGSGRSEFEAGIAGMTDATDVGGWYDDSVLEALEPVPGLPSNPEELESETTRQRLL